MSIHTLFKSLLHSNTTNTISQNSSAEISFNNWKKDKEIQKEGYSYLTDLYINTHEKPRSDKKIAYETYNIEKKDTIDEFYKKHKTANINKLINANIPEVLFNTDSRIFTKYNLPSLMEVEWNYETDDRFIIINKDL
jgi:hypothetical protein